MTETDGTVLIVEDQEGLAEAYEAVVEMEYDARVATSGEQALERVDDGVDVVLLDRRMPGMSGDQVLAEFVERGIAAKVAMLTAVEPDTDIVEMACDDYVTKPIDNDELLGLVDTLLKRSEYDRRIQRFFRLAAKKAALEQADKESTDEYERLVSDMAELREEIGSGLEEMSGQVDPRQEST
ncbi:response regulator [Halovenus sp. WSH3]|uniref:Response regulator n=1 Tax=Halovenus carboxidivorans TaxID=2692199 RepID=A0A6B0TBY3_9EURY|nr:response regulator [Halovenus carboxidivorans]MXR53153.1 response regulator [Halovenus carboxidivorans]